MIRRTGASFLTRAALPALLALASSLPLHADSTPSVEVRRDSGHTRVALDLGGTLVGALAPGGGSGTSGLWLLVRPPAEPDGARRLLRLVPAPEPRLEVVAEGLPGWIKTLVAVDLGAGVELAAGGLGRLESLGPIAAPTAAPRTLIDHPGFDARSLAPGRLRNGVERRLAAAEAGTLRIWDPDGAGGLAAPRAIALPVEIRRSQTGLQLSSPPVAAVPDGGATPALWAAGPEPVGKTRLRTLLFPAPAAADPATEASEATEATEGWAALPGAESVEQSWIAAFDGAPALVVRTQGAARLDLFEHQRLRVFPLTADRTRAGVAPALATELDSRRWFDTTIQVADVDADGHDDLAAFFPEGLTGGDLVVEVWRGQGGARFERRGRRTDVDDPPDSALFVPGAGPGGRPGLLLIRRDRVEMRLLANSGRHALERDALWTMTLDSAPDAPAPKALGSADVDGRGGPDVLLLSTDEKKGDRLTVLLPRSDCRAGPGPRSSPAVSGNPEETPAVSRRNRLCRAGPGPRSSPAALGEPLKGTPRRFPSKPGCAGPVRGHDRVPPLSGNP